MIKVLKKKTLLSHTILGRAARALKALRAAGLRLEDSRKAAGPEARLAWSEDVLEAAQVLAIGRATRRPSARRQLKLTSNAEPLARKGRPELRAETPSPLEQRALSHLRRSGGERMMLRRWGTGTDPRSARGREGRIRVILIREGRSVLSIKPSPRDPFGKKVPRGRE